MISRILIFLLGILLFIGGFFAGRYEWNPITQKTVVNVNSISQISEWGTLRVNQVGMYKRSNKNENGSWSDGIENLFNENTMSLYMPYEAVYGAEVDSTNCKIRAVSNDSVVIDLPKTQLLSVEFKLDKVLKSSKQGIMVWEEHDDILENESRAYQLLKKKLQANPKYIELSTIKLQEEIKRFYGSVGVGVSFE
jgi:hypothetical protein